MDTTIQTFIKRWKDTTGTERANYQLFLTELCALLDLPQPDPSSSGNENNAYVFERRVDFKNGDGSESKGFIDLYRRGAFVCEAKQSGKVIASSSWDKAMLRARGQAEQYARALPSEEGRPPFLIVTDVGRSIELYAEFSRSGATYTPYPDPRSHRIRIEDLAREEIRERLRQVWLDPLSLDPTRRSAKVTRDIADQLARLARSLEGKGLNAELVSGFLMRCLFTMFAEDVGLLPERAFTELLESLKDTPEHFAPMLEGLWQTMNTGGFSPALRARVMRFNGGLFARCDVLDLDKPQIELLIQAARADWRYVEPAIFGTLLERALNPRERHKLGAHYTPRAYVERLVMPTVIEPLRDDWQAAQAAAWTLEAQGKTQQAINTVRDYLHNLCQIRVLDPACGSGNFLYVTLEHMKRLEGEVLNTLAELEPDNTQMTLEAGGLTVDPHQFLGIELNPRAATIAEMVLWIGYLQWHFRTHGNVNPPEPVLRDFHNIENRDAVLAYDSVRTVTDDNGDPVTRWDGVTTKTHPVTGKPVPDESARIPLLEYENPRKADWPEADFIVGNPPFIGAAPMRAALGDGYVETLRKTWKEIPESSDFVMYWWHKAAETVRAGNARRFGFITTNSLRQTFNRRVAQAQLDAKKPLSLIFAIPDHPWVDAADGADVRIAMTVGQAGELAGTVNVVTAEQATQGDGRNVVLKPRKGKIHADLTAGVDFSRAKALLANSGLCSRGVQTIGAGFIITREQAAQLGLGKISGIEKHIREYRNGRDITQTSRDVMVIDLFGLTAEEVRDQYPSLYQWVFERVKPDRDQNKRASYRDNWWIHGEPRKEWRRMYADIDRYIATVETSKHRFFVFLEKSVLPDNMLVNIAVDSASIMGVLSSRVHTTWALRTGGRLGVGNDPRYNKSKCFETFPFPEMEGPQSDNIRMLAEKIDTHRKRQQAEHPKLTLTNIYNVLEKLRAEQPLTPREKETHEQGLVAILRELHDDLDRAVFEAYGWSDLADELLGKPGATTPLPDKPEAQAKAEEELLARLVALNAERAAEEQQGKIRWLRPDFQNPSGDQAAQAEATLDTQAIAEPAAKDKHPWPRSLPEQVQALRAVLDAQPSPVTAEQLARQFKRAQTKKVEELLQTLTALGNVRQTANNLYSGLSLLS